jgi:hypothetical protein
VFNLKGLIVLRAEKTAFKKFGMKKLAGTFLLQMQATYFQERVTGSPAPRIIHSQVRLAGSPTPENAFLCVGVLPAPRNCYF